MKHTVEALNEAAVALDHHLLSERSVKFVAAALVGQIALGFGVLEHMQNQDEAVERSKSIILEADASLLNGGLIMPVPPRTHPKPVAKKSAAPSLKPSPKPSATIRLVNGIQRKDIILDQPPATNIKAHKRFFSKLVRQPDESYSKDISWPQCESQRAGNKEDKIDGRVNLDVARALAGTPLLVLGVNGGKPLTSNNCLKESAKLAQAYDFYLNAENPGLATMKQYLPASGYKCPPMNRGCIAEAYGYLTANHAVQLIKKAGLHGPKEYFWIDVEHPNPWSGDGYENRLVVAGMIKALKDAYPKGKVGFYSIPQSVKNPHHVKPWDEFMGIDHADKSIDPWLSGHDTWIATAAGSAQEALKACKGRKSFTGGDNVLSQYSVQIETAGSPTGKRNIDANVLCPKT